MLMRLRFVLLLAACCTFAAAQTAIPSGFQKVTSVEGITEYQLPNGLKVLLFPDPSKETITVNMTYLVGSRNENYGEKGMAHLLEHLVFKGTPKHANIAKELTDHGTRPNGSTWFDRTNYFETFTATEANLEWALDLEADRMVNSYIARKDLDSEMTVVRNEFEMGENNPFNVLMDKVLNASFLWHNYGKTTIGARSDIENVPIEVLQAFYRKYYEPDNAMLVVAGKIDEAKTLKLIDKYYSPLVRPSRKLIPTYTTEPTQDGERQVTLHRVGDVQEVIASYHVAAGTHADFAALDVLTRILADTPSGRLYKALVETKKAARVTGFGFQLKDPGVLLFNAQVRKENNLDEVRTILTKTIDGLKENPASDAEVDRAKTQLAKHVDLVLNSSEQLALQLSEWEGMGDWRLFFLHRDRIRKITTDDVKRVAATYLKPSNRTLGLFIPDEKPERAEIPAAPDVKALLKDYKGDATVAQGEAFDPSTTNIDARTRRGQVGDGIKIAFIPKKTRANTVSANIVLHFGDEKNLASRGATPNLVGQMLMRGTQKHTRQQIQDEFDKLKAQVMIIGSTTMATAYVQTTRENLTPALKLIAEILKEPSFPESEFEQLKQQQLAQIETQRREPMNLAPLLLQRHLNPYPKSDVRYYPDFDEQAERIKAATLADVKSFHADFYGASKAELGIAGDFDPEATQTLVSGLFGNWKNKQAVAQVERPYQKITPENKNVSTPDKANAFFMAGMPINISDEDADYPALVFGNFMIGGGFLNSRLAVRIRQKDGLSYGVGSALQGRPTEKNQIFMTYAICAPQNVPKVEVAFKEEIVRALKDGFTDDEVQAAKKGWLQGQQVSRAQDPELVRKLTTQRYYNRTMAFDAELEKKVQELTPAQIVAALRRHLKVEDISIFKAGDFKNVTF
jgi:zinc protease